MARRGFPRIRPYPGAAPPNASLHPRHEGTRWPGPSSRAPSCRAFLRTFCGAAYRPSDLARAALDPTPCGVHAGRAPHVAPEHDQPRGDSRRPAQCAVRLAKLRRAIVLLLLATLSTTRAGAPPGHGPLDPLLPAVRPIRGCGPRRRRARATPPHPPAISLASPNIPASPDPPFVLNSRRADTGECPPAATNWPRISQSMTRRNKTPHSSKNRQVPRGHPVQALSPAPPRQAGRAPLRRALRPPGIRAAGSQAAYSTSPHILSRRKCLMLFLRDGGGAMRYLPSGSLFASPILQSVSNARLTQRGLV